MDKAAYLKMQVMTGLNPVFAELVAELLVVCEADGLPMRPFFGVRDPFTQARLWRQSRTKIEVNQGCQHLRENGAPLLALCIASVGPQHGRWATNAMPGYSWHQWGEAIDCYAVNAQGGADWNAAGRAFTNYAARAVGLGLTAGANFHHADPDHVQHTKGEIPVLYRPDFVEKAMALKYPSLTTLSGYTAEETGA